MSRRRRRKNRDRPSLEFLESPLERFVGTANFVSGEPIEFPTIKLDNQCSSQWVSPQIRQSKRLKQKGRTRRSTRLRQGQSTEISLANVTKEFPTILEYDEENVDEREKNAPRNLSCGMFEKENLLTNTPPIYKSPGKVCNDDSPVVPFSVSTPDIPCLENHSYQSSSSARSLNTKKACCHYLFEANTPVMKDFVVLVENTPF